MFCLRSWIPILFFLTNASPIYLVLFISATYFLNRPCVYCSLLLAILVIALFDFNSNWFEPRYYNPSNVISSVDSANATNPITQNVVLESLTLATSVLNSTTSSLMGSVVGVFGQRHSLNASVNTAMTEWLKSLFRKEWRIECLDVVIRL